MSENARLTPEDRALAEGDAPDLVSRDRKKVTLVQTNSPELVVGDRRYVEGARAGGFVIPCGDTRVPVASVEFVAVGFAKRWDEYFPARGQFVDTYPVRPADAVWLDAKRDNVEKTGLWRRNGNRVVEVVACYMLLGSADGGVFDFYGGAFPIGRAFSDRAGSMKATVGGDEIHSCTVAQWGMTSNYRKEGDRRWFEPVVSLLGKLGEPKGPTIAQWRTAQTLRRAFRDGTPFLLALEDVPPPPPLTVIEGSKGRIDIRSAKGGASRWNDDEVEDGGYPEGDDGPPWDDGIPLPDHYDGPPPDYDPDNDPPL
jgi:hypothetical protein